MENQNGRTVDLSDDEWKFPGDDGSSLLMSQPIDYTIYSHPQVGLSLFFFWFLDSEVVSCAQMTTVYHFLDLNVIVDDFFKSCKNCTSMEWNYDFLGGFWTLNSQNPSSGVTVDEKENELCDIIFGRKTDGRMFDLFYVGADWKTSRIFNDNTPNSNTTRRTRRRSRANQNQRVKVCDFKKFFKPMKYIQIFNL